FGTRRRWPNDYPRCPSVVEALAERTLRGLAIDRDRQCSRVPPRLPGQGVECATAGLDLSWSNTVGEPAIAPGDHTLQHILGEATQHHWRMRLLRWFRVGFDRWEIVVLAMELRFFLSPQLLHDQDRLTRLRPAMVKISTHDLRLFAVPASANAE